MKMKAASYLMIMIMLVALASLFVLKRPDGKPWLNISSLTNTIEQQVTELTHQGVTALEKVKTQTKELVSDDIQQPVPEVQVYRWQDAKGQWHYSDKPNPNGESQHYQLDERNITVIAAEDTSILNKQPEQVASKETASSLPTALNPKAVKQVLEDAKNIQQLMDDRTKKLEKALEENQR